jgi:hypothetical protein
VAAAAAAKPLSAADRARASALLVAAHVSRLQLAPPAELET